MTPRKVIQEFGEEQEKILKNNDHKQNWTNTSIDYLCIRLNEEFVELLEAIMEGTFEDIQHECVDVANFAMMIHDIYGKKIGSGR